MMKSTCFKEESPLERIRVASVQYLIRPVASFSQFQEQVEGLVNTAADYKCRLVVFPEYFSTQLLTLNNVNRNISEQIRDLANQRDRVIEMMSGIAKKKSIYIAAGTMPSFSDDKSKVFNDCFFFSPSGRFESQGKLHMTRFEKEE
ncbi:MAG: hypothetical protein HUU57_04785, partial [Bdellovibrio sp.]|nr:hypothetical protein [Bdellovibrio sp.]